MACRILVPQLGIEPRPLQWNGWVLTPGPPRSSWNLLSWKQWQPSSMTLVRNRCVVTALLDSYQALKITKQWNRDLQRYNLLICCVEEGRILTEVMVNVRLAQGLLELVDQNFDGTWSEISSEGGHGNPLQYPCRENPTDRGTWRVTVHGVAERWTRLERLSTHVRESPGMLFKNTMFH